MNWGRELQTAAPCGLAVTRVVIASEAKQSLSRHLLCSALDMLLWPSLALADTPPAKSSLWLNAGFYSLHFDTQRGLRNPNPGLGLEYRLNEDWSVTAGRFMNSDSAHSNYVGAYYQPWAFAGSKWGVVMGAFNGYPLAFNGGWFPAVLPVVSWEGQRYGLNVAFVPPLKDRLYGAVSFQLKVKLGD